MPAHLQHPATFPCPDSLSEPRQDLRRLWDEFQQLEHRYTDLLERRVLTDRLRQLKLRRHQHQDRAKRLLQERAATDRRMAELRNRAERARRYLEERRLRLADARRSLVSCSRIVSCDLTSRDFISIGFAVFCCFGFG